ncbi:hypothetical protein RRG08_051151 [Elysia crispata]|uniref:C-type lectin domain-containing protein n=1 Tax=Elysia crispata TaxID=231223 RepID=A0AAE1A278_9GAST|nr:hypothetical protein RRG08_051151 [Elysia crispata]
MKLQLIYVFLSIGSIVYFLCLAYECTADFTCPAGSRQAGPVSRKWDEARNMCQAYGGDLVTILENTTLHNIKDIIRLGVPHWIGLKYHYAGNIFRWINDIELRKLIWPPLIVIVHSLPFVKVLQAV